MIFLLFLLVIFGCLVGEGSGEFVRVEWKEGNTLTLASFYSRVLQRETAELSRL